MNDKLAHFLLHISKPFISNMSLRITRKMQDKSGDALLRKFRIHPVFEYPDYAEKIIIAKGKDESTAFFYLHGGAYGAGDEGYVRGAAGLMAHKTGADIAGVRYRLSPEYPYPFALGDALSAYEIISGKYDRIFLFGDSAGGGMIFSLCSLIKEHGLKWPEGIIAFSPWADLTFSGRSYVTNRRSDPTLTKKELKKSAQMYIASDSAENPFISPVRLDTDGFPDTLIFAGSDEILLSDAQMMHENLLAHNVRSQLIVHEGMWHVYPFFDTSYDREIFDIIRSFAAL